MMNRKTWTGLLCSAVLTVAAGALLSATPKDDGVMVKEDGAYVVNTTTLGEKITGYVGTTPLKIFIKKNKVVKIEALKNQETPKHMAKVKKNLLPKWDGMKVSDALSSEVDGVTGATFTSDAVKANVKLGLQYYKDHK